MRILVVSNLYPPDIIGGYELSCGQMVDELRRRGHDVVVLTSVPRCPAESTAGVRRVLQLADVYDPAAPHADGITRQHAQAASHFLEPANVLALLDAIDGFVPDVVYFWNLVGLGAVALVVAAGLRGVPWAWHLGDSIPAAVCAFDGSVVPELASRFSEWLDGTMIGVSRHIIDETIAGPISFAGPVEIVPNWVTGPRTPLRSRPLGRGPLQLVTASQLAPVKGAGIAVAAVAELAACGIEVTLDVYGGGDATWLEVICHTLGVSDRVRVIGPLSHAELERQLARYDVFVFPTWSREPFAMTQLEAAAQGCLCVITRDCGNAEWMVDGVHCVKARRDVAGFVTVLRDVAEHPERYRPIAQRGQAVVQRDFHIEVVAAQIEAALEARRRERRTPRLGAPAIYSLARQAARMIHAAIEHEASETRKAERAWAMTTSA